jgi:hypothetical protein
MRSASVTMTSRNKLPSEAAFTAAYRDGCRSFFDKVKSGDASAISRLISARGRISAIFFPCRLPKFLLWPNRISLSNALNEFAERHVHAKLGSFLLTVPIHELGCLVT